MIYSSGLFKDVRFPDVHQFLLISTKKSNNILGDIMKICLSYNGSSLTLAVFAYKNNIESLFPLIFFAEV